jgi:hypothetical protein
VIDAIAEALYNDWRSSDNELRTAWADAPATLRGVFLRKAEVAVDVLEDLQKVKNG